MNTSPSSPSPTANVFPKRACPVCLGLESKAVFHQIFAAFSEKGLMEGYDVSICKNCGGAFADHIPPQEVFDRYYHDMSKYAHPQADGRISATDAERFRQVADLVSPHMRPDQRIADIGCATGGLLAEFKRRGFENLVGFDASPSCAEAARRLYGIEVKQSTVNDLNKITDRFDLIILTGVLEHLADVDSSLTSLIRLLKPGGQLYFEVPDATRYDKWYSAPYQFFSMEHVNFFSPKSLANLLLRYDFECVFFKRVPRYLAAAAVEPAVAGLFRPSQSKTALTFDDETEPGIERFLEISRQIENRIHLVIDGLVARQVPLAVWGAGTHTLRLLETSSLPQANIVAFLDSNTAYQGKQLHGIPIVSPSGFDRRDAAILISSHMAEKEIKDQIQNKLRWPNEVICLYEDVPVAMGDPIENL
jgi:SAM-dependent methyltransferase